MENLNAEQIKKALEWKKLVSSQMGCVAVKAEEIESYLALIKQLTEENERLRAENVDCRLGFTLLEDAFKRLEKINEQTKSDTVRKMQEMVNECFDSESDEPKQTHDYIRYVIDQIAKEMLEGNTTTDNKYVSCGETIPEGRQVCPGCEGGGKDGKNEP